ncbi:MAG: gliding motility protein GldM [Paludibacteraceae bacterium]|nr:gliding motility protein GldM [Paludibacteraceae bacterium]
MSGAKNCPETPRQKMIGMMYLVLTAMLALNVAAEILNGYKMVNSSLVDSITTTESRVKGLITTMEYMNEQNPVKTKEWLDKTYLVRDECDKMYGILQEFKEGIISAADGGDFEKAKSQPGFDVSRYSMSKPDNLDGASNYAEVNQYETSKTGRGADLQNAIINFRKFVEKMFDNDTARTRVYEITFKTDKIYSDHAKDSVDWVQGTFESMPAIAAVTMISKYQSDVRFAEEAMIQYFRSRTDAGDMRVNKITAVVIPDSKVVMQGGKYHAELALMAVDTTKQPDYYVNGQKLENCMIDRSAGAVGDVKYSGEIVVTNAEGERISYPFESEYSVTPPNATIANEEMNVVYRGYNNIMQIAVPGVSSSKLSVSASGASFTRNGDNWICKVEGGAAEINISVTANVDGKNVSMGSKSFRVRSLPNPTAFIKLSNGDLFSADKGGIKKSQFEGASVVAEYGESENLKANFVVKSFQMSISDGRGGTRKIASEGNKFSSSQLQTIKNMKSGTVISLSNIEFGGAKSGKNLPFAPVTLK